MSNQAKRRRQRRTPEQIQAIVREFRDSGQTRVAFARKRAIPVSTLDLWLRKHSTEPEDASSLEFVAVSLPPVAADPVNFEVIFPNGVRLLVPADLDSTGLYAVLAAVARC